MARVTATEVKEIIDTDLSDAIVDVFINSANIIVTDRLGDNTDITADHKKEIERWLSAHLVAIRDQRSESEKVGDASVKYQGKTGLGLDVTLYGQQVKVLDTTGTLDNLGKPSATLTVIDTITTTVP